MVTDEELARRQAAFATKNRMLAYVLMGGGMACLLLSCWLPVPRFLAALACAIGAAMLKRADPPGPGAPSPGGSP